MNGESRIIASYLRVMATVSNAIRGSTLIDGGSRRATSMMERSASATTKSATLVERGMPSRFEEKKPTSMQGKPDATRASIAAVVAS